MHGILGAHLEDEVQLLADDAVGIVDVAVGTGEVGDLGAQLSSLLHDAPAHVAVAGNGDALALDGLALVLEDFLQIIDSAVAGSLGTDQRAAVAEALTGENAVLPSGLDALVLAVEEADLAAAHADITGGNVHIGADVTPQLGHKGLAEAHNFHIGLADGAEVGAALAAADGQRGQAVLEGLLEAQELHGVQGDVAGKTQAALVGSDGAVELDAEAAVDMGLAGIVHPGHTELDLTIGLAHSLQNGVLLVLVGVLLNDGHQRIKNLFHGLQEQLLVGIASLDFVKNSLHVSIHCG